MSQVYSQTSQIYWVIISQLDFFCNNTQSHKHLTTQKSWSAYLAWLNRWVPWTDSEDEPSHRLCSAPISLSHCVPQSHRGCTVPGSFLRTRSVGIKQSQIEKCFQARYTFNQWNNNAWNLHFFLMQWPQVIGDKTNKRLISQNDESSWKSLTLQFTEQYGAKSRSWGNWTWRFTLHTLYPTYKDITESNPTVERPLWGFITTTSPIHCRFLRMVISISVDDCWAQRSTLRVLQTDCVCVVATRTSSRFKASLSGAAHN